MDHPPNYASLAPRLPVEGEACETMHGRPLVAFLQELPDVLYRHNISCATLAAFHVGYFWHLFDQVLIRPDLLRFFRNESLCILTEDGHWSFLSSRGTPGSAEVSDHLPVLFALDLPS
jgi:hypothetical protein